VTAEREPVPHGPRAELQHALVAQLPVGGQHRVAIHRQRARQLGRRRQLLADGPAPPEGDPPAHATP